ncbi:MAG: rod shape-determining protein MreD [Methylomicrobium sp.]
MSILLAMGLNIADWPPPIIPFNPNWVLLVLVYWVLAVPDRVGIFSAWTIGLLTDVLTGRILGLHALINSLVAFLCLKLHKRLRQYPILQQGLFIFFCLFLSQLLVFWLAHNHDSERLDFTFWLPVLSGTFCWPLVFSCMRALRLYRRTR